MIVMRYLLEFTPGEIADALDLPRGTVNSRLRRGLDALGRRAVKNELERIEIPDETRRASGRGASSRRVRDARARRAPARHARRVARRRRRRRAARGVLSPPGQAVLDEIREAVGVERGAARRSSRCRAGAAARRVRCGRLGRAGRRLEAAARRVPRGELVAVRPLRGRRARERARRARAGRRRALDARASVPRPVRVAAGERVRPRLRRSTRPRDPVRRRGRPTGRTARGPVADDRGAVLRRRGSTTEVVVRVEWSSDAGAPHRADVVTRRPLAPRSPGRRPTSGCS